MSIKAVVFDYGKVICFPPAPDSMEANARRAGVSPERLDEAVWKYRDDYDRGSVSGEAYYQTVLGSLGIKPAPALIQELLSRDLDSWKQLNPATVQLMEEVKAAGLRLGILSNMPHDFLAFARRSFPVFSLPDAAVFSCEVNAVKPEPKIYETLLQAIRCSPQETVFFDDLPRNIATAEELGMQALLWSGPEEARLELRRRGAQV